MKELESVPVPEEFVTASGDEQLARWALTKLAVLELVRTHVISAGKGAKVLDLDRWTFADLMAAHHIPTYDVTPGELEQELTQGALVLKNRQEN